VLIVILAIYGLRGIGNGQDASYRFVAVERGGVERSAAPERA